MPVLTMYRDGEVAYVNTDHVPTYENFLAHGWVSEAPKVDVAEEAPEAPAEVAPEAAPEEVSEAPAEAAPEAPAEAPAPRAPRKAK